MRRTKNILIALVMIAGFNAAAQECLYKQGLERYRQRDYLAADSLLATVLNDPATCPDARLSDVHYWRAWSLYRLGRFEEAVNDFRQAEGSPDNGMTALYMRLRIMRQLDPNNAEMLNRGLQELNVLLARPTIHAALKDKALLYRNLLRLQLGEISYHNGDLSRAKDLFQGITSEESTIGQRSLGDINALVQASAITWLLHIKLGNDEAIDDQLLKSLDLTFPSFGDDRPDMQELANYYRSLMRLFDYLVKDDYSAFIDAKNIILSLNQKSAFLPGYKSTFDLLEENYSAVIDANIGGDAFDDYKKGWAHFLRNDQTKKDLRRAETFFKKARDAYKRCQSSLRKASAFRAMHVHHFRDWQDGAFVEEQISAYFSKECINNPAYVAHQKVWINIFEEGYGYIQGNCQTGRGYLDLGLYKSKPDLVERGKRQLLKANCGLDKDDLSHAILLCIGQKPDYAGAITLLSRLMKNGGAEKDEVRYALAMAYYNNNQPLDAIPLLDDLAKKGSLDACYKLATIYFDKNEGVQACRYLSAIIQRPNVYTIYRSDANRLYSLVGCGALGVSPVNMPAQSSVQLRYPDYNVFAYDYVGDGVGVVSKLFYEMKSEIVKFIRPQMHLDLYDSRLLEPSPALTAYINLLVHPLPGGEPGLSLFVNGEEQPNTLLQKEGKVYVYNSGPLDMGDFKISVRQRGSFGWTYENFISGNFRREIYLDSAFVFQPTPDAAAFEQLSNISHVCFANDGVIAFTPDYIAANGQKYQLPRDFGVVASVAPVGNTYYCLVPEQNAVKKVTLLSPDSIAIAPFIRGVYDPQTDIPEYSNGLVKPLKILYNEGEELFYILNVDGFIYEFNSDGHCVGAIAKPTPAAFIIDLVYDSDENGLWLLDIATNTIHKFDLSGRRYDVYQQKKIDGHFHPFSLLVDEKYFYLADIDGGIGLHKKSDFRRLQVFSLGDENFSFVGFALTGRGLHNKKTLVLKKQSRANAIRAIDAVQAFKAQFNADFQTGM